MGFAITTDYIIVQYVSSFLGMTQTEWCRVAAHGCKNRPGFRHYQTAYRELSRKEAMRLIREKGLVCVQDDRNGKIYDTPDRSFQRKYENNIIIYAV